MGDGYSLAWRIMDARYHGVPQRRRRITLIVDFAGDSASEVLFNEEGMCWDFETSQRAWKAIATHFGNGAAGGCGYGVGADLYNMRLTGECAATLKQTKCVYWDGGQVANTLTKKGMDQRMPDKGQFQCVLQPKHRKYIVRRLTPLECSRLQGMPDDWCDIPAQSNVTQEDLEHWRPILDEWAKINGKQPKSELQIAKWLTTPISESAQYQMYGNGIALPQWVWTLGRIIETYGEHKPTMASLFDGTGSFPLIWNSILGGAYTVWSSEVNPDAVRVSKYRMQERGW